MHICCFALIYQKQNKLNRRLNKSFLLFIVEHEHREKFPREINFWSHHLLSSPQLETLQLLDFKKLGICC